jgi:hypothetical protein
MKKEISPAVCKFIDGLRALADWYEAKAPALDLPTGNVSLNIFSWSKEEFAEKAKLFGGEKVTDDSYFMLRKTFAEGIRVDLNVWRQVVCERVLVATEVIPEHIIPATPGRLGRRDCDGELMAMRCTVRCDAPSPRLRISRLDIDSCRRIFFLPTLPSCFAMRGAQWLPLRSLTMKLTAKSKSGLHWVLHRTTRVSASGTWRNKSTRSGRSSFWKDCLLP